MKCDKISGFFAGSKKTPDCLYRTTPKNALLFGGMVLLVLAFVAVSPVAADSKYITGSPDLNAHIIGTNEFSPGDDINLGIAIENKGLTEYKIVKTGIMDSNDVSSTAKQLTVALGAGNAPVVVKADPQIIGDLLASGSATATLHIKVNQDAPAGTYTLPIALNYTYLYEAEQYGTDTLEYRYKTVNKIIDIPVKIKSEVQIEVPSVKAETLNAGNEGYVILTVKNIGYENGRNAAVKIQQNDASPVSPSEGSVYIGDFPQGAVVDCRFRVAISGDAQEKTYPLDVLVHYKNAEGDFVDSKVETIGVPVGNKVAFSVIPVAVNMSVGGKSEIRVKYENTGGATAYNAQARISAVDPFTSNDDTAFLGTMAPGDIREAAFLVSTDAKATAKEYGLDSEVIYRDSLNNQITSDPVKVNVRVVPREGIVDLLGLPVIILIILLVLAGAGYLVYTKRTKPQ
ncbi:MAG TPA: S-layer protein [Methanoregula sp.]|nr:S-layer protein [Methanoregula sp.]